MLFESYIGAQKYRSGLLERYFAPVKGFLEELLGLFYGRIKPFYSHGARGERVTRASRCDSAPQAARHHGMMRGGNEYRFYTFPTGENYRACHAGL